MTMDGTLRTPSDAATYNRPGTPERLTGRGNDRHRKDITVCSRSQLMAAVMASVAIALPVTGCRNPLAKSAQVEAENLAPQSTGGAPASSGADDLSEEFFKQATASHAYEMNNDFRAGFPSGPIEPVANADYSLTFTPRKLVIVENDDKASIDALISTGEATDPCQACAGQLRVTYVTIYPKDGVTSKSIEGNSDGSAPSWSIAASGKTLVLTVDATQTTQGCTRKIERAYWLRPDGPAEDPSHARQSSSCG